MQRYALSWVPSSSTCQHAHTCPLVSVQLRCIDSCLSYWQLMMWYCDDVTQLSYISWHCTQSLVVTSDIFFSEPVVEFFAQTLKTHLSLPCSISPPGILTFPFCSSTSRQLRHSHLCFFDLCGETTEDVLWVWCHVPVSRHICWIS